MGTERFYKPGSFYRICDRTGFAIREGRTRKEWNNLIVSDRVWEARQPQDFVKGVDDNQTVPNARPRQPNVFIGETSGAYFDSLSHQVSVQGGQIHVYGVITAAVDPSKFPSGF
jgi:hypothetical protein